MREFLRSLDRRTQDRFAWSIEQLRLRNLQARAPLVRHIEGKLWELREESQTNIYRIFYAFLPDRSILLLHGFQKRIQKVPRREIEAAFSRLDEYVRTMGDE